MYFIKLSDKTRKINLSDLKCIKRFKYAIFFSAKINCNYSKFEIKKEENILCKQIKYFHNYLFSNSFHLCVIFKGGRLLGE